MRPRGGSYKSLLGNGAKEYLNPRSRKNSDTLAPPTPTHKDGYGSKTPRSKSPKFFESASSSLNKVRPKDIAAEMAALLHEEFTFVNSDGEEEPSCVICIGSTGSGKSSTIR